ncbi:MAPEG family protein [Pseudidiomarina mangrovi]|uniref:MAPEG family protein n=1 Tax=Pseudidiomarina mangrovi TaxID=2487133 RepID=UPI000FCAACA8|nr:MAPEG family protein [Pseudidiomarina mangrovi]
MEQIAITGLYASLLTLLYFVLAVRIIKLRWRDKVPLGTGDSKDLLKAVRVHANFNEYVPLVLVLLLMMELTGASMVMLHVMGGVFFLGRVLHAMGITKTSGTSWMRFCGMISTFVVLLVAAGYLLGYFIGSQL